jgi:hypothetical protein
MKIAEMVCYLIKWNLIKFEYLTNLFWSFDHGRS